MLPCSGRPCHIDTLMSMSDGHPFLPLTQRCIRSSAAPNARGEPRPMAGATQERTLLGVGSSARLGAGARKDASSLLPPAGATWRLTICLCVSCLGCQQHGNSAPRAEATEAIKLLVGHRTALDTRRPSRKAKHPGQTLPPRWTLPHPSPTPHCVSPLALAFGSYHHADAHTRGWRTIVPRMLRTILDHTVSWYQMHFCRIIEHQPYLTRQDGDIVHRVRRMYATLIVSRELDDKEAGPVWCGKARGHRQGWIVPTGRHDMGAGGPPTIGVLRAIL